MNPSILYPLRNLRAALVAARLCAILLLAVSLVALEGCRKKVAEAQSVSQDDPSEINVSPGLAANLTLGTPKIEPVTGNLQVSARVETDANRIARVGSPVAGRILKLIVLEGETVRPGAVLAMLHSTDLSDTQFALIKASSQQALAEAATHRAEQLVTADVIGRAELERRQAELLQASTEASSYRTQLHGLGMSDGQIQHLEESRKLSADYPIVTPKGGTVLERKVTMGQVIQPADLAYTIADLSSVWIVADVPEEEAGAIRKGMEVSVRIPALPDYKITGRLSYVSPIVNPETRTVQVRMELANPHGNVKPEQLASMTFIGKVEDVLTVPQTALVREDNKDYVFVQTAPNRFALREVVLGDETNDQRVLKKGVREDERIVTDGAFHLNNQRKQNAIKGGA